MSEKLLGASDKVKSLDELSIITDKLRQENKKVVLSQGAFDLLHPEHYRHFERAKKQGDILIVIVSSDSCVRKRKGAGRPVFNEELRAKVIAKNEDVDYVCISDYPTAVESIQMLKPAVYVKGNDYKPDVHPTGKFYDEKTAIESIGGRVHFTGEVTFTSTSILNRYFNIYTDEVKQYFAEFSGKYSAREVIDRLKGLSGMRVLVVGDAIIDQYHYCKSLGKSPKENIIPARYMSEETFAGGSLASANHVAGFCDRVHLVTSLGMVDSYADFISSHLKTNVLPKFFYRKDTRTIVKRRFVEPTYLTKLFEVCHLEDGTPQGNSDIVEYLSANIGEYDLVLVTDFGHGLISQDIIDVLCKGAKFLAVNAQTNSDNAGFNLITKYPKADYICLDDPEIRLACHDRFSDLESLIEGLAERMGCERVAVTHGRYGTVVYDGENGCSQVPVLSGSVVDTMGAGDAFLSVTSPLAASGAPMDLVGFVGQAVGALKCQIVGNKESVEPVPLYKFITALLK